MNVYVVYRFDDYEIVKAKIQELKDELGEESKKISFFYFAPNRKAKFWHKRAKRKIKNSNMVVVFDNLDGECTHSLKHIKWELRMAEKYRKRIFIFKKHADAYSSMLYEKDYSEHEINHLRYKTKDLQDFTAFFKGEISWNVENYLLHPHYRQSEGEKSETLPQDKSLLLQQYSIMIDTSEKLMERRQATVNLYITICTALIAFIGASFGFDSLLVSSIISLLSGVIIIILCLNWRAALNAYELNNQGKFAVINEIEKHLPADMFDCEYRYNTLNGIRSYSAREKILPVIFTFFGVALIILSAILFIIYWKFL